MRPQWLQKDKSRVGKQSEMAMRRAARRGLGGRGPGYIGRHQVASRRWLMLIIERFRGLKVTMSKVKGRRHQFALPGGPGSRDAAQDLGTNQIQYPAPQGGPRGGLSSARARQSLDQTGTPGLPPADATPSVPAL